MVPEEAESQCSSKEVNKMLPVFLNPQKNLFYFILSIAK